MTEIEKGLISVIVPVYNAEKTIKRCINGIQNSTYKKLEIILVDDGSTDKSYNICQQMTKGDSRIKLIHKENSGAGETRNAGIKVAKGEYVAFVDADDWPDPNMYEEMIGLSKKENLDVCYVGNRIYRVDKSVETRKIPYDKTVFFEKEIKEKLLPNTLWYAPSEHNEITIIAVWMGLYANSVIQKNNIEFLSEREYYSEDSLFNFMFLTHSKKVGFAKKSFYNFVRTGNSLTTRENERISTYIKWYQKVYDYGMKHNTLKYVEDYLNHTFCQVHNGNAELMLKDKDSKYEHIKKIQSNEIFRKIKIRKIKGYSVYMKIQLYALKHSIVAYKIILRIRGI